MRTGVTSDLWWKNAVIYGVDVKTFQDSDGDGIGDFDGLGERLDYWRSWASAACGCCRSCGRRGGTTATMSPTTSMWTGGSAPLGTWSSCCGPHASAASG